VSNTDFVAFATASNALVLGQTVYGSETWIYNGFSVGIADPASCNTVWRQSTFVACGITQWMANTLNRHIYDDGNLTNFVNLFGSCIKSSTTSGVTSFNGRKGAVVLTSADVTNALGYTPVISFNGRGGVVTLTATDVNNALGYIPVNKGNDTMGGFLSGLTPTAAANFATKSYVDSVVATGTIGGSGGNTGITGNITEYTFPLGDGGYLKIGNYFPASGIVNGIQSILMTFVTPFPTTCVKVDATLVGAVGSLDDAWSCSIFTDSQSGLTTAMTATQFVLGIASPATYSYSDPYGSIPSGFIWTAIGY
jgi:hypothetical protein